MKDITASATEAAAAKRHDDFPHLSKAPIGEAVIEFRGRTEVPWNEGNLLPQLREALPDYPLVRSEREIQQDLLVQPNAALQNTLRDLGCKGFDFRSRDELQIAKFHRDLFSFSRLRPYQDWQQFTAEAMRLWRLHNKIAVQTDIQRLGVRFINQFELSDRTLRWDQYLKVPPGSPKGLDLKIAGFFHRDVFAVAESALLVSIVRALQPGPEPKLILDIDVFTTQSTPPEEDVIIQRLSEMRWFKNNAFFSSVTEKALISLR